MIGAPMSGARLIVSGRTASKRTRGSQAWTGSKIGPLALASGALALSCATGPSPAGSTAPPPEPVRTDAASSTTPPPPANEPASASAPPNDESAPSESATEPTPDPAALCERLCQRVEGECKEPAAETCRAGCKDYVQTWERCPVEVEDALVCQTEAQDAMLCANVAAASCVPTFSELAQCRAGRVPPRTRTAIAQSAEERVPRGWQRVEDSELGISILLPSGAARDDEGKRLTVQEGELEYVVESPPRLQGEPTDKALLKAVLDYLGTPCHKALKVHGRFETGEVVHVHFDTACKDGTHWRGMLHVSPERMIATSARSRAPFSTEDAASKLEALFYGFQFLPR